MKTFARTLLALGLPLFPVCTTFADFNPAIVGGDSRWVVYVDLDTLRASTLGKELIDMALKAQPKFANGAVQIDIPKVLATVGTITAYGANFSQDPNLIDGTLVIQGTPDLRKIAEGFVAQATVTTPERISELKNLPFETYLVAGQIYIGFPAEPIILVSKSKEQLIKAREIFRGSAPSLAKNSSSPLGGLVPKGGHPYVLAASMVPTEKLFSEDGPQARVLQMASSGSLGIGEEGPQTTARIQLAATSDEMGDKLMKILQGMTAMLSFAETSDKKLAEFLKSVTVERSQKIVTLHLGYASDRLVEMLKMAQAAKTEQIHSRPSRPLAPRNGKVISEWKADQDLGDAGPSPKTLVDHTIENVHLVNGSTITVMGQRDAGENARLDYVEITPMGSTAQPLRFEAETMKLTRYRVENVPFASGGKLVLANEANALAQFSFPGSEGLYRVIVRYVDESDGVSTFTVSVKDPEAVTEEK